MAVSDSIAHEEERVGVLVAEDDAVVRLLLQHWFTGWGFDVTVAANGIDAWELLQRKNPPKLVLVDWMMPGLDGIELCRKIRQQSAAYYQYILMVTGRTDMGHVVHALESGADDCIGKPFEEAELKARISVANRILALQDALIEAREELRQQAMKDSLTGLWNRAAFQELFERELRRARRTGAQTGLLLLDLDHFKPINDTYGHITGDMVLRKVAERLLQNVRTYDFVGRFGGEEFLIGVSTCNTAQIRAHAERIRAAVAATPIRIGEIGIPITFSIGAAAAEGTDPSMETAMSVADVAMYRAKRAGRNCVVYCDALVADDAWTEETPQARCAACSASHSAQCVVTQPAGPAQ